MGDRVFVELNSQDFTTPVVIYSHWAGESILGAVTKVLGMSSRVGDANYLAAQIINSVFKECYYDGELGFGIAAWDSTTASDAYDWADNPTVFVDLDKGYYWVGDSDITYDRFGNPINAIA